MLDLEIVVPVANFSRLHILFSVARRGVRKRITSTRIISQFRIIEQDNKNTNLLPNFREASPSRA